MNRRFIITLLRDSEGVAVSCPELPGCHSQGAEIDEALENIRSAIVEYLEIWGEPEPKIEVRQIETRT